MITRVCSTLEYLHAICRLFDDAMKMQCVQKSDRKNITLSSLTHSIFNCHRNNSSTGENMRLLIFQYRRFDKI